MTPTSLDLSIGPAQITDEDVSVLERFAIMLYDRTCSTMSIDEALQELFTKKGRATDAIPQLELHIKRAVYNKVDTAGARCSKLPLTAIPCELGMS